AALNVQILYQDNRGLPISGYSVNRSYLVHLSDPKKFQTLVDTVLKNGGNKIIGFEFSTKELRKYLGHARGLGVKAAREKAEAVAGELHCKPGSPRTINESGGFWGYCDGNSYANGMSQNVVQIVPTSGEADDGGGLPLGQIAVRANVTVTFDLAAQ